MNSPFAVDVVIAVHTPERPVKRAVASVLLYTQASVRVNVVAHNTDSEEIMVALGEHGTDPRLRILTFLDNTSSPAGPKNYGLKNATAEFVTLLDSDDEFEPSAIDRWLEAANMADVVISPVRRENGGIMPAPPVRIFRRRRLVGNRDRLSYRVGVWGGLIRRSTFPDLQFVEGLRTGEDQLFTAQLWFSGARIVYPVGAPAYVLHADQPDRVTNEVPSVEREFEYLSTLLNKDHYWSRSRADRIAMSVRLLRMQVFDSYRSRAANWSPHQAKELAEVVDTLVNYEPDVMRILSVGEAKLVKGLRNRDANPAELEALCRVQSDLRTLRSILPARWWLWLHRQALFRTKIAGALLVRMR